MYHLDPEKGNVAQSLTRARDGDGGSPDAGVPTGESQAGYPTLASLAAEPSGRRRAPEGREKGQNLGETKPLSGLE